MSLQTSPALSGLGRLKDASDRSPEPLSPWGAPGAQLDRATWGTGSVGKVSEPALPGQRVVQVIFWKGCPSQKEPPFSGAGLVHVRVRFCQPRPQRLLQGDHSDQVDQPPFTARGDGQR